MDQTFKLFNRTVKQYYKAKPSIPSQEELLRLATAAGLIPEKTKFGLYKTPVGIEVELERIKEVPKTILWCSVEDNSLRNGGLEFVSLPVLGKNIDACLQELRKILEVNSGYETSVRCSTHVHINVSDLDVRQVQMLIALYACFENVLFDLHNPMRRNNPYCYPVTTTGETNTLLSGDIQKVKYCALNTGHLRDYGTIEFRHMEGLESVEKLERWIQVIQKLVQYCKINDPQHIAEKIFNLNTNSEYSSLAESVFYPVNPFRGMQNLQSKMEDCVTWAKLFLSEIE